MAERYQRYKTKGLALRMPTVDFSFEQTRSNNLAGLSNSLDRMSEIFYKNAVQTAKIEGAEYGALNAPTEQQLLDASESNTELDFVGDKDTVFGRYARTATLEATSDKLTLLAKQDMSAIILNAKQNSVDPTEVAKQLDSVVSGLADVLDTESPVTAKKFKATLGLYSNAEYKTYASKYITDRQKELQATYSLNFENVITNELPKIIQSGVPISIPADITKDGKTLNKKETVATTFQTVQTIKNKILASRPVGMSAEAILALEKRFDDRVFQVAKDVVNDSIIKNEDPQKILDLLNNNKFEKLPIAIRSAFSVVEGENKAFLKKVASDAVDEKRRSIETKIAHRKILNDENIRVLEINASNALLESDPSKRLTGYQAVLSQMQNLDPKKAQEMREELKDNPELKYAPNSNSSIFNSITIAFNEKEVMITQATLNNYLVKGKLSKSDYDTFSKNLRARNNTEFNRALADARSRLKIPVSILGNSAVMKSVAFNTLKNIEEGMYRARRDDPNFVPSKWLDDNYLTYVTDGEVKEFDILKELAGNYLNLANLNKLINQTSDTARKNKLIDDKARILEWNRTNDKKLQGF